MTEMTRAQLTEELRAEFEKLEHHSREELEEMYTIGQARHNVAVLAGPLLSMFLFGIANEILNVRNMAEPWGILVLVACMTPMFLLMGGSSHRFKDRMRKITRLSKELSRPEQDA